MPYNPIRVAPDAIAIACLLGLALACSALAYLLFLPLVVGLGASRSSVVGLLVPVFSLAWGALLLHEAITLEKVLSCAVILLGAVLVTGMPLGPLRNSLASSRISKLSWFGRPGP